MQKITLTIHEKDYPVESYTYSMYKTTGIAPDAVNGISVSLGVIGKNDLNSVMMDGPFVFTLTSCDETGAVLKQMVFEDAKITSYCDSVNEQTSCSSIQIDARAVQFDGRRVAVESETCRCASGSIRR